MADSEEDLHSDDSDVSEEFDNHSDNSDRVMSSTSEDDFQLDFSYSSETSIPSSQQQWHHENRKPTHKEQVQFQKLSRHGNQLLRELKRKEKELQQARESLYMCRVGRDGFEEEYKQSMEELQKAKDQNSVSSLGLLNGKLMKLQKELDEEKLRERKLAENVTDLEIELAKCELRASQYEEVQTGLTETERSVKLYKQKQAMFRAQGQTRQLIEAQRLLQAQEKMMDSLEKTKHKEEKLKREKTIQAERERKRVLNEAIKRRKEQDALEEMERSVEMENRMKVMLDLKKNIESSQNALQAKQLLVRERKRREKRKEEEVKMESIRLGINPQEAVLKMNKEELFRKQMREFNKNQKERELSIVSRLIEEERIKKKEEARHGLSHWHNQYHDKPVRTVQPQEKPQLKKKLKKKAMVMEHTSEDNYSKGGTGDEKQADMGEEMDQSDRNRPDDNTLVLEPDIPGLWQTGDTQSALQTKTNTTKMSKMEKDIMNKTLGKLKSSAVIKQVAAGREFKGQAFLSKPAEIIFKDFQVGKVYSKRVQLTNVSYTVNYCKLVGVSDHLKDFIDINFNPPGAMSAGLTCQMTVQFSPKINADLAGNIELLSQTGPIHIPIHCCTKKCIVAVESEDITFGSVCVGETVSRTVIVHNEGALSTRFSIVPLPSENSYKQLVSGIPLVDNPVIINTQCATSSHLSNPSHRSMLSAIELRHDEGLLRIDPSNNLTSHSSSNMRDYDLEPLQVPVDASKPSIENEKNLEEIAERINGQQEGTVSVKEALPGEETDGPSKEQEEAVHDVEEKREGSEGVVTTHCESTEALDEFAQKTSPIRLGKIQSDTILPYSTTELELMFSPESPGDFRTQFKIECDEVKDRIVITASGKGIAVPIYVEKEVLDLKICLTDLLYQDSIVLHNRSVTPLHSTFIVPQPLSQYLEILPKHGLVQGESSFAAQLKFLPTKDLLATDYVNPASGLLQAPVTVSVTGQTALVPFLVKATVSVSDVELSPSSIEFGACTTYESVVSTVSITNHSCLPLDFGFIQLPKWVAVQPNEGFGTLLPHETLPIEIIFSPDRPKEYSAQLTCKTAINKDVELAVRGTGVLSGLSLSHSAISFTATPYGTISLARLSVHNPCLSRMDSAVIRGVAPPQGTKMFEFHVPDGLPIKICPHTGSVETGKSIEVSVSFSPVIDPGLVAKESAELIRIAEQEKQEKEGESAAIATVQEDKKPHVGHRTASRLSRKESLKSGSKGSMVSSNNVQDSQTGDESKPSIEPPLPCSSEWWWKAYTKLLHECQNQCYQWSIPCFVSHDGITHKPEETLFLEVTAAAIRPSLVIASDDGSNVVDFKRVGIRDSAIRTVVLKNITNDTLTLSSSPLSCDGTFEIRNALRPIPAGGTHSIILQFAPNTSSKFYETLRISYMGSLYIELTLKGEGVNPDIKVNPSGGVIDWGHVMSGDKVCQTLQLVNPSMLTARYNITLDSALPNSENTYVRNYSGQSPFNCVPFTGKLSPESSLEMTVEFAPDHPRKSFTDKLHIDINSKTIKTVELRGSVWTSNMYILGGMDTRPAVSSMEAQPLPANASPVLLVMRYNPLKNSSVTTQLEIGCIKSGLVKKGNGEFSIDPLQGALVKCFVIEPMKSSVEAGGTRSISVKFTPPQYISDKVMEVNSYVNLKGDTVTRHKLLIQVVLQED